MVLEHQMLPATMERHAYYGDKDEFRWIVFANRLARMTAFHKTLCVLVYVRPYHTFERSQLFNVTIPG